jgi:transcriptional regulator with XRE-family HTH domain
MSILNNTYFEEHAYELLTRAKLNKAQFAEKMGVARQNIQKVFETKNIVTLQRAASVLGVPLELLILGKIDKCINGYIEINDVIYPIKTVEQFSRVIDKVEGVVHIPSFKDFEGQHDHKEAITEFLSSSVIVGNDKAIMGKYGYDEVFTLTYDAKAERLSLTLCIGDGEIRFRTFSISDYRIAATLSRIEMIKLLEDILTEIEMVNNIE